MVKATLDFLSFNHKRDFSVTASQLKEYLDYEKLNTGEYQEILDKLVSSGLMKSSSQLDGAWVEYYFTAKGDKWLKSSKVANESLSESGSLEISSFGDNDLVEAVLRYISFQDKRDYSWTVSQVKEYISDTQQKSKLKGIEGVIDKLTSNGLLVKMNQDYGESTWDEYYLSGNGKTWLSGRGL